MSHLAVCRSWFRKALCRHTAPALAALRQKLATFARIELYTDHTAVRTCERRIWNDRTEVMTSCEINFWYHTLVIVPTKSTAFAREIKSGMASSLLLHTTFLKILHQFKREKTSLTIAVRWWKCGWNKQSNKRTILTRDELWTEISRTVITILSHSFVGKYNV